ncbi:MAG TPA: helix-turn-helix domain-containing protein [Acidimicrobiales bacterium]|nr:helix-turn-helix domain-containing protein [Acidimicrobiales bacterium]
MPETLEKLLTPEEVAKLLGVPIGTVYRWNYRGNGPARLRIGKHVRYRPADVARWLEERSA